MDLKDSGERRKFETGAVRDMNAGKGRCDLMPLDVISELTKDDIIKKISCFKETGEINNLYSVALFFISDYYPDNSTALIELSKHYEDGAKKYGENNWQKGIPISCYIDSAIRHYLKHKRGDIDEPHDRAFLWNITTAIWTINHHPELNNFTLYKEDNHDNYKS